MECSEQLLRKTDRAYEYEWMAGFLLVCHILDLTEARSGPNAAKARMVPPDKWNFIRNYVKDLDTLD